MVFFGPNGVSCNHIWALLFQQGSTHEVPLAHDWSSWSLPYSTGGPGTQWCLDAAWPYFYASWLDARSSWSSPDQACWNTTLCSKCCANTSQFTGCLICIQWCEWMVFWINPTKTIPIPNLNSIDFNVHSKSKIIAISQTLYCAAGVRVARIVWGLKWLACMSSVTLTPLKQVTWRPHFLIKNGCSRSLVWILFKSPSSQEPLLVWGFESRPFVHLLGAPGWGQIGGPCGKQWCKRIRCLNKLEMIL